MERDKILRSIWVKARELGLYNPGSSEDEIKNSELYELVYRETQKDSMRKCTDEELKKVLDILNLFTKQSESKTNRITKKQLDYIKYLSKQLKWDNPKRLKGFIKKYTGVEKLSWLTPKQASNVIEGLKKLLNKERKSD